MLTGLGAVPAQDLVHAGLLGAGLLQVGVDPLLEFGMAGHIGHLRQRHDQLLLDAADLLELGNVQVTKTVDVHGVSSLFQRWTSSSSVVTSRSEVWRKSS